MKMMKLFALSLLIAPCAFAADPKTHRMIDQDDAYKNNCMRCHAALPQYSPRMNKTVLLHMRLAANLPGDEAQAILKYLNGPSSAPAKPAVKSFSQQR